MRFHPGPALIGLVLLLVVSPFAELASQEARPSSKAKAPFQSIVGHAPTLRGLIERARPIPRRAQFVRHFQALELAARVYSERHDPGDYVFGSTVLRKDYERLNSLRARGAVLSLSVQIRQALFKAWAWQPVYHWQVLEVARRSNVPGACARTKRRLKDEDWNGFQAVTYINRKSKRIVVAIAGTDPESKSDIFNDLVALRGKSAPHFEVACAYLRHVMRYYGSRFPDYSFECSGHSLGGGACSVAASRLGRAGITLNPIGTQRQVAGPVIARPSTIANYIDPKDFALDLYKKFNLHPSGRIYWISDKPVNSGLLQTAVQFLRRQPKIVRLWESYLAHSATLSLDDLAKYQRLQRLR